LFLCFLQTYGFAKIIFNPMKKFSLNYTLLFFVTAGLMTIVAGACKRYKMEPTKALIRVIDADGQPVQFSKVRIYALPSEFPPPSNAVRFDTCGVTSSDGSVEFDFTTYYEAGQAGFAVLDVTACKSGFVGEGIIKITEEENNEETITILSGPCTIPSDCE